MKYPICPISNCYGKSTNKENRSKGSICVHCQYEMNKNDNQKVICKCCGEIYIIREKIRKEEEEMIVIGYCYWCKQRKEEEDRMIEDGIIGEEDRTTEGGIDKLLNNLGIKKNDKPMSLKNKKRGIE